MDRIERLQREAFKVVLGREISNGGKDKDVFLGECRHHSDTGGRGLGDGSRLSSGTTVARETRNSLAGATGPNNYCP